MFESPEPFLRKEGPFQLMTPEEEAYEETLRRIRKAEEAGAVELDLGGLDTLNRLSPELERLTRSNRSTSWGAS